MLFGFIFLMFLIKISFNFVLMLYVKDVKINNLCVVLMFLMLNLGFNFV